MVRRTRADATSSSGGNSFLGNMPSCAVNSHASATTRNGKAVRAIIRQRSSGLAADVAARSGAAGAISVIIRPAARCLWIYREKTVNTTCLPMRAISSPQYWPSNLVAALAMLMTLAAGVAGGFTARYIHLPLPWLLGSLVSTMALSVSGAPVRLIPWGRPAGTVVVGASTGLQFTATVVTKLLTLLPLIIVAAFFSTLIGAIGGLLYMRLTGIDRTTAFFATVPGGVIETTNLAPMYGGHLEPIMVAQTTRVALIVVFAPFLVLSFAGGVPRNPLLTAP